MQNNEVREVAKFVRMSPSKVRRVLRQIEGKTYLDAYSLLKFLPYAACAPVMKVLCSVSETAVKKYGLKKEEIVVKSAFADQGPTMKRFRSRAKGRAARILKFTTHITIIVN